MKIGVIVESFKRPLPEGVKLAAGLGCSGIQVYGIHAGFDLLTMPLGRVRDFRKLTEDCGMEISAVCGDMPGHGYSTPEAVDGHLEKIRRIVDMTLELDCRIVTNHIGVVPSDAAHPRYAVMTSSLRRAAEIARRSGATIAIETGPEPAEVLKRLLGDVDSPGLGINLDPANLKMVLNADPAAAVRLLGKSIVHTHAKDGIHYQSCDPEVVYGAFASGGFDALVEKTGKLFEETPLGAGQVDWDDYLAALREVGFDGYLTIERETGDDPAADVARAVEFLKARI